ncbi:hypothetical protein N6H14_16150 [Paenibacillus sp. CC-CFT747]|nr:hypothetical protein N6H14_16150 [Paenibacillus sp. CC-CFT747]
MLINHVNIANEDNQVYCCLRNRVVTLDPEHKAHFCSGCKMFKGEAGGAGVECLWEDQRQVAEPYQVSNPYEEWMENQARKIRSKFFRQEEGLPVEGCWVAGL